MKKIFLLIIFAGAFFVSCDENLLEPFTPGSLTEDVAITTSEDLQKLMNSTYGLLTDRSDIEFSSVFTDEVGIGYANGGQGINDNYIFFLNSSSSSPDAIWNICYWTLARANRVINFADKITPIDAADAELLSRLKAEALTVRAICHIRIMSYFSTDLKNDSALAGVLADRIIVGGETLTRSTNGEFYSLIQSDLTQAIAIFNVNTATPYANATYYASKSLATAMKARAYALKGDYVNAEIWADQTIADGPSLANTIEYTKLFWSDSETSNTEVIFRLRRTPQQNSQTSNLHNVWCSVKPNLAGSPFYEVSRALYNILDSNPTDIRKKTIVAPSSVVDVNYSTSSDFRSSDKLIIQKHGGVGTGVATWANTGANGFNNDFKICRISEMYFIKAEARVASGDLTGAAATIKSILDKRFLTAQIQPVYANATQAWADILNQRRLEFAYEGYRFIDIKRLGVLAGSGIDRDPADYLSSSTNFPAGNPTNMPLNSYKWALPIPLSETNANGSIQQNPNY